MNQFVSLKMAAESKVDGVSKETSFRVDPRILQVEPGFNRPISRDHVESFKTSMRAGAIVPPIQVRVANNEIILVDGEHRKIAACELIEEDGAEITLSAIHFRGNDAERVLHKITSSQGQGLSPLESGQDFLKLVRWGWSVKKIADSIGRSVTHVEQNITLAESNSDVQNAVRAGEVSGTLAVALVKQHGEGAGRVISESLDKAKQKGKKKVTAATVKRDKPPVSVAQRMEWLKTAPRAQVILWMDEFSREDSAIDRAVLAVRDAK